MTVLQRIAVWGSLVKFSHSVFALPFALMMVVFVSSERPVTASQIVLLILCVVSARTAAMAFNRLIDAEIDAKNPRTANREIPTGLVTKGSAFGLVAASSSLFIAGAYGLGSHCLVLSPIVLAVLLGYSLMKRVSSLCHIVLGLALALAPGGVWYALTGEWSWRPVPLMVAVILWVSGFDILYSCQDAGFDKEQSLFSIPTVLGIERAMKLSMLLHVLSVIALFMNGVIFHVGGVYWLGVAVFSAFLVSQHRTVHKVGLSSIDQVFFTRNGAASIALFVCVALDAVV